MAEEEARAITPIDSEGDEGKLFTGSCCRCRYCFVVWGFKSRCGLSYFFSPHLLLNSRMLAVKIQAFDRRADLTKFLSSLCWLIYSHLLYTAITVNLHSNTRKGQ